MFTIIWVASWVYGEVTLVAADHMGWAVVNAVVQPIAVVHGAGHYLGQW